MKLEDGDMVAPLWQWLAVLAVIIVILILIVSTEIGAKIFLLSLIGGMAVLGLYAAYDIDRIKKKWEREGKSEREVRREFYDAMRDD